MRCLLGCRHHAFFRTHRLLLHLAAFLFFCIKTSYLNQTQSPFLGNWKDFENKGLIKINKKQRSQAAILMTNRK